jgi:uncharacterized protein (TIRG00374 family)
MFRFVKLAIGLALLALLGVMLDWGQALEALAGADPTWVLAAFLVSVVGVLISARKWQGLLEGSRVGLPFTSAARLYWIGAFFSNFLPSSVGGDAVRLALTPSRGRTERVAGSIVAERLTGLLVMLGLCVLGLSLGPWRVSEPEMFAALAGTVLALNLVAIVLLVFPKIAVAVLASLEAWTPRLLQRPLRRVRGVALAIAAQRRQGWVLWRAVLLSVPFYATIVVAQYCVLAAVDAGVPLVDVMLLGAIVPLLTMVPISLNGIGVAEGAFVVIYAAAGAAPELALAAAVLRRLVDLANSALGGLFWLGSRREEGALVPA